MRVDETRKKEHFVLRNDTLRFENPEHYVLRIILLIRKSSRCSLAPWANGGMRSIGDTRSVSGLHEGSQSVIGDGGQGKG